MMIQVTYRRVVSLVLVPRNTETLIEEFVAFSRPLYGRTWNYAIIIIDEVFHAYKDNDAYYDQYRYYTAVKYLAWCRI